MYPTNYMNPMNNQPMSPDYGYNRMQQVQQMQQAINPTVPNMFGQMNQMNNMNQQQQTPYISAIPVTCLDEAKVVLLLSNAAAKPIATLMLFVQKTTKTLVKSLLQFMRKLKQLAR